MEFYEDVEDSVYRIMILFLELCIELWYFIIGLKPFGTVPQL